MTDERTEALSLLATRLAEVSWAVIKLQERVMALGGDEPHRCAHCCAEFEFGDRAGAT